METARVEDVVPGTIYLVDETSQGAEVVLNPRPSADPEDPLNWTKARKLLAVGTAYIYVIGIGIATAVQYSVLTQISEDTGITLGQLNLGTGLMFLFLGWGCLFWQPVALVYGRRGVYIISCILSIGPMVWTAYSSTAGEWYAHRILIGIIAAPVESLPEVTIPDLFFAHDRGSYMGIYAFLLFGANFLAPFFAGFINDSYGWRWVMHFGSIVLAVCSVILFFCMEETMYFRHTFEGVDNDSSVAIIPAANEKTSIRESEPKDTQDEDTHGTTTTTTAAAALNNAVASAPSALTAVAPPRTYWQKLNLFIVMPGRPSKTQLFRMMYRPLLIMIYFPCVSWAGLLYGTNLSWYNILNATTSMVLNGAPYNFSAKMVGVAYLAPFTGAAFASVWSGVVSDKVALYLARRNNGVREPEQRLWPLLVSGVFATAGLILWGVGAARNVHFMGLIFGLGMLTFGVVCGGSSALSYDVDCFKELTGETMITVIIIRNTLGFAFSYAITPWIENQGLLRCFIAVSMVSLACTMTFLLMVVFGKALRRFSRKKYWEYVATSVAPQI